jgi:hypothetical protein
VTHVHTIRKALAIATAALAVTAAAPLAAFADSDPVGIGVLRADATDPGLFAVPVWTDDAGATLTSVTASIRSGADTITSVPLIASGGLWSPASALKLTGDGGPMPGYGEYTVEVSATDSAGDTVTRSDVGTLDYRLRPEFANDALTFPDAPLGWSHQHTHVTGTLEARKPGTGAIVPLDGKSVTVTVGPDAPVTVQTAADGSFTTDDLHFDAAYYVVASVDLDDATSHGSVQIASEPSETWTQTSVDASPSATRVEPGHSLTIRGTVTVSGTTAPVAGATVRIRFQNYPDDVQWTATTDAKGKFQRSFRVISGPYPSWSADVVAPFLTGEASGQVVVPNEGAFVGSRVSLAANGRVRATGTLTTPYGGWVGDPDQHIWLEYSRDGRTGWKVLARGIDYLGSAETVAAWGYATGYYRLYHPTSDDVASTASTPVRLARTPTRIAANDARPEPVRKGARITVTGTLQQFVGSWRAMARKPVNLYFQPTGAKTWRFVTSGRTDARGRAGLRATATRTGKWLLQYFGDGTHFDSYGLADAVTVR